MLNRIEMDAMLATIKPGDVFGFSGRNWLSTGINVSTFGIPLWGISHVGIAGYDAASGWLGQHLYESVGEGGVRCVSLKKAMWDYDGRVWLYRLSRQLYLHEMTRLMGSLRAAVGREYDVRGAMRAGGAIFALIQAAIRGEDLTSLFCSELVAEQLSHIGYFPTANSSRWSPNHLVRKLRRMGLVNRPVRLK